MTADSHLICRRCGFTNVPGDQFCGSCGAFLEWEGERIAPATPPGGRDPDVPSVDAGPGRPVVPSTQTTTAYVPSMGGPGRASADGTLVRCPACGIANAASRTFCQACGTKLAEAGQVAPVTREQIAAAVNAPNRPVPVTTTTIRPARPDGEGSGSGGILKWVAIMAVLGVLVGAGIVGASVLLRGDGPLSEASIAPTASAAPVETPAASGEPTASSEGSTDEPTDAPTAAPPKPQRLALLGASASSVVGNLPKFGPDKAIDGDAATCWQEGNATEKGQWIEVVFSPSEVTAVIITNGYNASKPLYRGNRRLKDIEVSVDGGDPIEIRLDDTGDPQRFNLPDVAGAAALRITIVSTYPPVKTSIPGTPFDDAALGEIAVVGVPGS